MRAPPRSAGKCRMRGSSTLLIAVLITVLASCATSSATSPSQPFAFHQDLFGQSGFGAAATFRVPADRLLVIEAVTAQISLPVASQSVTLYRIATQTGDRLFFYNVPVFEQGADTGVFVAGQQVRLYAAPGSEVQLLMRRNANQGCSTSCRACRVTSSIRAAPASAPDTLRWRCRTPPPIRAERQREVLVAAEARGSRSEIPVLDQGLGDLDGVERGPLAQVVGDDPQLEAVRHGGIHFLLGFPRILRVP